MRPILASALLVLLPLFSLDLSHAHDEWSATAILERYGPAVVRITALDRDGKTVGSGSGFFLDSRGSMATNYHVLERASKAVVRTRKDEEGEVLAITHADPSVDLLIAETSFRNTPSVSLGNSDHTRVGERAYILAYPDGRAETLSTGSVSHVRKAGPLTLLQVTAPIFPGCSGGPVFNASGEVVGVATAYLERAHFALPANYLRSLAVHSSPVNGLRGTAIKLGASLVNKTVVEVVVQEQPGDAPEKSNGRAFFRPLRPLTVYFRSGKKIPCDVVWMDGETLFLVARGRHFAVGYELHLIDMKRSLL